jgi:Fe-S-cluster containining protein
MPYSDALKFSENFVIGLFVKVEEADLMNDVQLEHAKASSAIITATSAHGVGAFKSKKTYVLTAFFGDGGYSYTNENLSCSQLDASMDCTLHSDKPMMCKLVPFDVVLPDTQQTRKLHLMERFGCVKEQATDASLEQDWDIIYRDNQIVSPEYKNAYDAMLQDFNNTGSKLATMFDIAWENERTQHMFPPLQFFINSIGSFVELDPMPAMMFLKSMDAINERQLVRFASNQVDVLDREIQAALRRKDKHDRATTNRLRNKLSLYRSYCETLDAG